MNKQAAAIIRSYLLLTGLYTLSASLIWGVNTLFLLDAGLSISQAFLVNAIFTAAMALFEIPTGVLADTKGRRLSFLLSLAILFIGTLGYLGAYRSGGSIWLFALASVVLGLGFTFYSGAMEAWLVDALRAAGFSGELDDVFARGGMITAVAMLIGTISGGIIAGWGLALPYLLRALLLALLFVIAYFTMRESGFSPRAVPLRRLPAEMSSIAKLSVTYGWRQPSMRLLVIAGFIQAVFSAWGFYAWQPYFLDLLGRDATWVAGLVAALMSLATMGGNYIVRRRSHQEGRRTTLLLVSAVVAGPAIIGMGLVSSFWAAVTLFLLSALAWGMWTPVKQAYMHQLIPSEQRATVVSFDSLVSSGGMVVGQIGLGQLAEMRGIGAGYVVGGLITVLSWPVVLKLRRRHDPQDIIAGDAGRESACAAQGIPHVSAIDAEAGAAVSDV